jgi:hypothetical protein
VPGALKWLAVQMQEQFGLRIEISAEIMVSKTASAAEIIKVIYGTAEKMNRR